MEDMVKDIPKTRSVVDLKERDHWKYGGKGTMICGQRGQWGAGRPFDCTINAMGDIRSLFEEENKENGGGKGEPVMAGERPEKKKRPYGEDPGSGSCPLRPAVSSGHRYGGSQGGQGP